MFFRTGTAGLPEQTEWRGRAFLLLLLAVFLVNVALRLPGALQELPPYTNCDEDTYINPSYAMYRDHTWRPDHFLSGGINFYAPVVVARAYEKIAGKPLNNRAFVIVARAIGPIGLGAMLPVFLMLAAREISRRDSVLFWVAAIGTLSPLALAVSRVAYPDHAMAAPAAALLWLAIRATQERRVAIWVFAAAGALVGLVTSIKYSGIALAGLFAVPFVLSRTWADWRSPSTWLGPSVSAVAAIAAFLGTNPYLLISPELFLDALKWQQAHYAGGHPGLEARNGYLFYAGIVLLGSFGVAGVLAMLAGVCALARRNLLLTLCLVGFVAFFILWLGGYRIVTNRNMMVVVPIALLLIALGIATVLDGIPRTTRVGDVAAIAAIVLLCAEPAWRVGVQLKNDFQPDARAAAAGWIAENLSPGEPIGHGPTCWGVSFNQLRNPVVEITLPEGRGICVRHYVLQSWLYEHWGKGNDPITWPNISEQIQVNIGGVDYRQRRSMQDDFLKAYKLRTSFSQNSYYGPSVYIFERIHACPY